ncbi:hypothetical protein JHK87_054383 [Glycine soja]|nr:hypothetical protein JHK87_054383 [Glycine soja]
MAISELSLSLFMVYVLSIFSNFASLASSSSSTDTICNLTPYPTFCESNSPSSNIQGDIHEYGRFFAGKSLSSSKKFVALVSKYLYKSPSNFSNSTILALQDCHLLGDLNKDFWHKTQQSINSTNTLSSSEGEKLHNLLSATLTNHDTCLNSLHETTSSPDNDLLTHLSNGTKFYSISLAIFKRGWVNNTANKERKLAERNYHMWEQKLYEIIRIRGRKLFQLAPDNVVVSQRVVVNPDGSGNFTTINDAVVAAPNNTGVGNGFFVIHVVAGVYEEYVSIPKNKQYLMMIGDGINQTIITGNRSVVDGWTTFNSATFEGWKAWSGDFALDTLYYAEFDNQGPGSNTSNRVTWPGYHVINATDAVNFTVANFIIGDAWLPATGVPYYADLLI